MHFGEVALADFEIEVKPITRYGNHINGRHIAYY
jgi:hypothetical protein